MVGEEEDNSKEVVDSLKEVEDSSEEEAVGNSKKAAVDNSKEVVVDNLEDEVEDNCLVVAVHLDEEYDPMQIELRILFE